MGRKVSPFLSMRANSLAFPNFLSDINWDSEMPAAPLVYLIREHFVLLVPHNKLCFLATGEDGEMMFDGTDGLIAAQRPARFSS